MGGPSALRKELGGQGLDTPQGSLARQRTLEDEEEQERERRRRQRSRSSSTDEAPQPGPSGGRPAADRLPSVEETEGPESPPPAPGDGNEGVQAVVRTRQERRQRRRAVEVAQTPTQGQLEAGGGGDSLGPAQVQQQPLVPKREVEAPPRRRLSREQRGPWAREEESLAAREPGGGLKGVSGKPAASESPFPEKASALETRLGAQGALGLGKPAPERTGVTEKLPAPGKPSTAERRLVSEKASVFEKSPGSGTQLVPERAVSSEEPQAQEPPAAGGGLSTISEQRARDLPEKTPRSSAEPGASDPPSTVSHLPPVTLQVKLPSKEKEADTSSPTRATYSSSLQRSSSRTISFRMSPRKINSEAALTRSASVRLPASTVKLGEKLERYHTAVQRSESVKSPGSPRTELFVAPVGVASKRHLFEKELAGQSRAEPASSRKEHLKLSGVVTSRLNLWISRTQESGEQDPQELRQETAATRRTQWGKKADSALDAEV